MNDERYASHPKDSIATAGAHYATAASLTHRYEQDVRSANSMPHRFGSLQVTASIAIARVAVLERQLAIQEQRARARPFEKTGTVTPIR